MGSQPAVVVGVDGSGSAAAALRWAIPEAISRDVPLRLVYAMDPRASRENDTGDDARRRAFAESVIRTASNAVASTGAVVKVEFEITEGRPDVVLLRNSRSAAMVCVGSVGFKRFGHGHLGSTAKALVDACGISAVAVVRAGRDSAPGNGAGAIVLEMDASTASTALFDAATREARLREAPIRAITCWQKDFDDMRQRSRGAAGHDHHSRAVLYRRLAQWKRRCPDLRIRSVTAAGSMANYLAGCDGTSIGVIVLPAPDFGGTGPTGRPVLTAALQNTNCSLLTSPR